MSRESRNEDNVKRMMEYRSLLDEVEVLEDTYSENFINKTKKILEKSTKLLSMGTMKERTEHPTEQVLSSKVILNTTLRIKNCTRSISGNTNTYDPKEFANCVKGNLNFWMNGLQRRIPRICTLSGNLACIDKPKERKERKKVVRQELGAQSEPENIADANTPTEITDKIIQLRKIVNRLYKNNGRKPLSFYNLVLHPESFKQTLENIFYMSFSLSEGYFSFTIVDDLPHVTPVSKEEKTRMDAQKDVSANKQFVFSMNMEEWKEAVEAFGVTEPMITF